MQNNLRQTCLNHIIMSFDRQSVYEPKLLLILPIMQTWGFYHQ